jgi:hypothetical protein
MDKKEILIKESPKDSELNQLEIFISNVKIYVEKNCLNLKKIKFSKIKQ